MKLKLIREIFTDQSTIGSLFIDGVFFCFTLEDKDRGLNQSDSLVSIAAKKIFSKTAIPYGTYELIINKSPKLQRLTPRLVGIKGFEGVLIHRGNHADHSAGCVLVGYKKSKDWISESTKAEADLLKILAFSSEKHTIEIVKI